MLAAIVISTVFGLADRGVKVVGAIPPGLPQISWPQFSIGEFSALLVPSFSMALIAFTDVLVNSRSFAMKNRYTVDADQEMIGLGAGNVASALLGGFPISSSSARWMR